MATEITLVQPASGDMPAVYLATDTDSTRCVGLGRYSVRCQRRGVTHATGLCVAHRGQDYACRACGDEPCADHEGSG